MVGDNEAVQPVKGDVRRYIDGGYKPVGATSDQVLTQGPDWDGINRGIGMFLDLGNNYVRGRSGGSGKQDYSGQYQVEMNDIASNPAFHNANGTYNSKGNEAIRALNQKYAPYVSGAEIRATESHVGGGYKESVDSALRESFIKQQTADYEAQNKRFVEMYDAAHPENVNAPYETRARLGRRLSDQAGEFMDLTNTLRNNKIESITDPAKRRMAQILIDRMNPDQLDRFINSGDTVKDQQELTDSIASLAVQLGSTPQEAMVMATDASRGVFAHLNKYKNDIQQLSEDELKFMKSHDADEAYIDLSPEDKAFYALTGQFSPNTMAQGLAGNISVSDAFKTTKVGDTYKRKLITSDKNVLNFALNNGDSLTASAALNNIVPQMQEELNKGNSAPLRMLNRLPSMANIVNEPNTDPETIKFLEDAIATDIVRNSRHYYKGDNRITDEMDYQNRAAVELAQFLGFSNEKTKDIVNKALTTMGLKQVNGVYTPDELVGAMAGQTIMPWAMEGIETQPQGKDVGDYLSDENKMTVAPTEEQPQVVNDETNQMSRVNVYETPEYQEFRNKIVNDVRSGRMTPAQAQNEGNQFLARAKEALARVASEFGVKSAKADTVMYYQSPKDISGAMKGNRTIDDSMNEEINRVFNDPKELFIAEFIADKEGYEPKPYKLSGERNKTMAIGHQVITDEDKQIAEQYKDTGIPKDIAANILKKDISERITAIKNKIGEEAYNRLPKELIAATADASMGFSPNTFVRKFGTLLTLLKEYSNTRDKKLLSEIAKHTHTTTASSSVTHSSRNKARDALVNSLT